ncbi:MAG: CPBP family intramembrane glutamic endopeptidase [Caulobacterales bacterium]
MSETGARLSDSAFLASVNDRDRSFWRFLATVVAGGGGGLIVGLIVGVIALVIFALGVGTSGGVSDLPSRILALVTNDGASLKSALMLLVLAATTNGPWAAVFIGVAALFGGHRIMVYLTAAPRFRWRLLASGLLFSFLTVGPLVLLSILFDPKAPRPPLLTLATTLPSQIGYAAASIALLIPAAAAEEVVFRGWLLRQTSVLTRNVVVLMALNGILFSAVHGEFAPDPFLTRALMGAGFVYMTLRLGGIEFSTGAHAANNILIVLFIQPLTLKAAPSSGVTFDSLFQDVFLFVAYVTMAEITARWGPLRRLSGADLHPADPATAAAEPSS